MYKKYYQNFIKANSHIQHYASHSHHFWPDVTRQAMLDYWDDSCRLVDDKWDYFFSDKIPKAQNLITQILNLNHSQNIVFAPNTHELVYRLISSLFHKNEIKILTTDSEFHSFDRQLTRLSELKNIQIDKIPTYPYESFEQRFGEHIQNNTYDFIFVSQVFYNSGICLQDIESLVLKSRSPETIFVIDGYHAFMALPTDLSAIQDRIFYIAGSYKYAQGGEGCCFMTVPQGCQLRPQNTGWFAGFSELSDKSSLVTYSNDGMRFAGSTMDFSALYRMVSVLELFQKEKISVQNIHEHVLEKQKFFLQDLQKLNHTGQLYRLNKKQILLKDSQFDKFSHGHFFTFHLSNADEVKKIYQELKSLNILTDYRGDRLRFGFGMYQEPHLDFKNFR